MSQNTQKTAPCPICKSDVRREGNRAYPFCSDRCKVIDLGKWLSGDYAIPARSEEGDVATPVEDEELH